MGVPPNGWFKLEYILKMAMDDLGAPLFQETSCYPVIVYIDDLV